MRRLPAGRDHAGAGQKQDKTIQALQERLAALEVKVVGGHGR